MKINYKREPKTTIHVELCPDCKGKGVQTREEMTDYHRRDYDVWTVLCTDCEGSGRIEVTTVTTRLPFVPKPPKGRGSSDDL